MKKKKWPIVFGTIVIIFLTFVLIFLAFFIINRFSSTGKSVEQITVVPLPLEQKDKINQLILSSELIKDIPKNYPVSLRFFSFENGQRIWHDEFIIGSNKKPVIYLALHTKYIQELNNENFCEVIQRANKNKDLGFYSDNHKAVLLIKYSGMLKYRSCLGI